MRRAILGVRYRDMVRITRLRFEAFKSLHSVQCDLDQFTVLTGPNNAGKSNFVDAVNFLAETFQHGLEIAVARAGGFDSIVYRRNGDQAESIGAGVQIRLTGQEAERYRFPFPRSDGLRLPADDEYDFSFDFVLTRSDDEGLPGGFVVAQELLTFRDDSEIVLRMSRNQLGVTSFRRSKRMQGRRAKYGELLYPLSDNAFMDIIKSIRARSTALSLVEMVPGVPVFRLFQSLGNGRVFQLSPHQCRKAGVSMPNAYLDRYGNNLPSVADFMRKNNPESWSRVQAAMRSVIPQLESIDISYTDEHRLTLQFREAGLRRPWNANEISDGTIQVLALLVALFDDRSPFLAVEEPENALHPWILRQFVDLCREHEAKQVLLTTHSPVVIDYVPPTCLRLVWQRDGRSSVARVSELNSDLLKMWASGEVRTFEAYDSGLLEEYLPQRFLPEPDNRQE